MGNQARYRRRRDDRVTITVTRAEAVEVLGLTLAAMYAAVDPDRRDELAALVATLHGALA
jgi:hypothetical protein